jgi:osmotically-inducible protein OsmY
MPRPDTNSEDKKTSWMGNRGFDEASYYNDEKFEVGIEHPDELIKKTVEEAYSRHYSLAVAEIEVEVRDGVVFLTGLVQGPREKKEATDLICNFSGVKAVRNDLRF